MTFIARLIRHGLVLGSLATAAVAVLALFGSTIPALDLLNHGQVLLFPGTVAAVVLVMTLLSGHARNRAMVVAFMGLAASAYIVAPEVVALFPRTPPVGSETIRMMTHNIFGPNYDIAEVDAAIAAEDPDIIMLQEYFGEQATALHPLLVERYPYFVRCRGGKRANLALYSRLPFEQVQDGMCPENAYVTDRTGHILARLKASNGKTFSIMTTHLDWPLPLGRQRQQLSSLSEVLDKIEGPMILVGDFNSTPWSFALRGFASSNALTRQTGALVTYPLHLFVLGAWRDTWPLLPLDHVMSRNGIMVHDLHAGRPTASDHLPVVFDFSVP